MSGRLDQCQWLPTTADSYPTMRSAVFVSGEDFLRLSMQAYYAACKDLCPPAGEHWLNDLDGSTLLPYADAKDLHDGLVHHLRERLYAHAHKTGHFRESVK